MNWKAAKDFVLARMAERTTWAGLLTAIGVLGGLSIAPAYSEQIAVIGSALSSLLLVLIKENGSQK